MPYPFPVIRQTRTPDGASLLVRIPRNEIRASLVASGRLLVSDFVRVCETRPQFAFDAALAQWRADLATHRAAIRAYWHNRHAL